MHAPHYSDTCQCRNCGVVRNDMARGGDPAKDYVPLTDEEIALSAKEYAARCDAKIAAFKEKHHE